MIVFQEVARSSGCNQTIGSILINELVPKNWTEVIDVNQRGKMLDVNHAERGKMEKGAAKGRKKRKEAGDGRPEEAKAREFLGRAAGCAESRYQSVGLGASLRYEGKDVIGSALAVDGGLIHMAFFRTSGGTGNRVEDMAAFSSRRRFRTE